MKYILNESAETCGSQNITCGILSCDTAVRAVYKNVTKEHSASFDERKTNEMRLFKVDHIYNINVLLHVSTPQVRHLQGAENDPAEIVYMLPHKLPEDGAPEAPKHVGAS
jgi:hypothetical protein